LREHALQKMPLEEQINEFLNGLSFAVLGASPRRHKYGNKVLRCYLQNGRTAYPINPSVSEVEGVEAYASLSDLPESVHAISIITPPDVTEQIVEDAIELGIQHIWMQPGAESSIAVERAEQAGINVISGGPCLLVVLGYHEAV
jgi:uncharacterized protein